MLLEILFLEHIVALDSGECLLLDDERMYALLTRLGA
jgi:hypothetical protein